MATYKLVADLETVPPDAMVTIPIRSLISLAETAAEKAVERYRSQPPMPDLLSGEEAQRIFRTSRRGLGRLAERGEITRVKVGGLWRYPAESISAYREKIDRENQ